MQTKVYGLCSGGEHLSGLHPAGQCHRHTGNRSILLGVAPALADLHLGKSEDSDLYPEYAVSSTLYNIIVTHVSPNCEQHSCQVLTVQLQAPKVRQEVSVLTLLPGECQLA